MSKAQPQQPDPPETKAELAFGFLESHRRAEELRAADLEILPSEKAFRNRLAKLERRGKEMLYGMGGGGILILGGTAALLIDPSSLLIAVAGVTGEIAGIAGLGSSTLALLKQQRRKQSLLNEYRDREPDQAEKDEQERKQRELALVEWDRDFLALSLAPDAGTSDPNEVAKAAKELIEHAKATGQVVPGSTIFDWRLEANAGSANKQLAQQLKLFNRLWAFRQEEANGSALMDSLSKAEFAFLTKSKKAPKMLAEWRTLRREKVEAVDRVLDQVKRGYTIDEKGIGYISQITNASINILLTWINEKVISAISDPPVLSPEQFLQRQQLLSGVRSDRFRPGAEGSPLLSPQQNRIMYSDYRSSRVVDRWETTNHDRLVALSRLKWFVEAGTSLPDDLWSTACAWQQDVIQDLQVQAQSLGNRTIGTGL